MARERIKNKQFKASQVGSQLPTCGIQVGSQLPTCDFWLVVSYQLGAQVGSQLPTHIKEKYIIELKSYSELKQKFSTFGRKTLCFTSESGIELEYLNFWIELFPALIPKGIEFGGPLDVRSSHSQLNLKMVGHQKVKSRFLSSFQIFWSTSLPSPSPNPFPKHAGVFKNKVKIKI